MNRSVLTKCALAAGLALVSCTDRENPVEDTEGVTTLDTDSVSTSGGEKFDIGGGMTGGACPDLACAGGIDLLFVIDNSGSMGEEQLNLAKNFPLLIQKLQSLTTPEGEPINPDVHIMVTTTDFGNPLCLPQYYSEPRDPESGAPVTTGCNERIARFTYNSNPPVMKEDACTEVCPEDVVPTDPFIHFGPGGDNVPDVPDKDVNGDGQPDDALAQALACIGPVGVDGCGYESQLEAIKGALDPEAPWNKGDNPFLRPGALTAIAVITDEEDCSVQDPSIMMDQALMEVRPDIMEKFPSSAICWNAGVTCQGPDADGVYSSCTSTADGGGLYPIDRYKALFQDLESQGKTVVMLGILGVPLVTAHNPDPPFQPTAGGVLDLVYRDWKDGEYPGGDILPDEWANGIDAAKKQFDFGIGPGCTGEDPMGGFTGQAIPPVRIKEVCESLNREVDGELQIRCCIESICDTDFSAALGCLTGVISDNIIPPA